MTDALTKRWRPALWGDSSRVYAIGSVAALLPGIAAGVVIALRLPSDEFGITAIAVFLSFVAFGLSFLTVPWMAGKVYRAGLGIRSPLGRGLFMGLAEAISALALFVPLILAVLPAFLPIIAALIGWAIAFALFCRDRRDADKYQPAPGPFRRVTLVERRGGFF